MIIIRYTGGLGNQMFEYALQVVISNMFPNETVYADLTRYDLTDEHDGFDFEKYFGVEIVAIPKDVLKIIAPINYWAIRLGVKRILRHFSVSFIEKMNEKLEKKNSQIGIIPDYDSTNYNENFFELNEEKVNFWHYKGNWINPKYWVGYEEIIRKAFTFKKEILDYKESELIYNMQRENSVAIHIRRGDYVGDDKFDICSNQYYYNAIMYINNHVKGQKTYYVFSEEIVNLPVLSGIKFELISHPNQSGIDLWMMSNCKHNIIANSTFSYWAAMLNENEDKIVIAPKYAYKEKASFRKLPVPADWVRIDNIH